MDKRKIVIIGSSGAGLPILKTIFENMPRLQGPIVLIQHMPIYVNQTVCDNLAAKTEMTVKIAELDERLQSGVLYVAPSEIHLKLVQNHQIRLAGREKVNFVCPSIDVAMMSVVKEPSILPMGILLSGIGDDGIKGIGHIKRIGGITIALEKNPDIITNMADEAFAAGYVDWVLNPDEIRNKLMAHLGWEIKNR